ncbi:hypothetical protein G1K81_10245 [Tenacibaculum finnmarkense]|uniref:hypothetical protein n=1 Tax=Tenacibaculum finnmarkense TaxID=2781243 RepID=UPI001EFB1346|nr:hypothetical protein [Tenacibaculum finnmarkense]MCG8237368.1 hypothetical protein [Tenacibaculum finnmarkense genomovar ulcerans]MCG8762750.1 hypothetical protein [Tenacibaculum finnmarkense]MCG8788127.1 hypothetical protein [Tenacibaculum finnmarkense]MCG8842270.1 hypothetical protein [Tenacibaculum finnmarkense]MCG8868036.1 hypothetical protein [Tenacibaculum finnmarkense]
MYKITTDGICNEYNKPYVLICENNPLTAVITDFKRLLLLRGLEFPKDLITKNYGAKIVLKYSFLDSEDTPEKVELTFKVEDLNKQKDS